MTGPVDEISRQTHTARARWLDPEWRGVVLAWVDDQLGRRGPRINGPVQQPHLRPWSTAMSIPTNAGLTWFKAGGPGNAYESGLLDALARWETGYAVVPIAVDVDRGWMLFPDGGRRLREMLDGDPGLTEWERILGELGSIQRDLGPRAGELMALGVPDRRPAVMPGQLEMLVEDPLSGLDEGDRARLRGLLPTYAAWCAELDGLGIEPSLQHDDLHDGNVFVGPAGDRIFDWGDASVAHPFGTLLVTFRSIADRGLGNAAAERRAFNRLRAAYLEPWTDTRTRPDLARAASLATRVAIVGRALSWKRSLSGIPIEDHGAWTGYVGGWLMELFEPAPR